MMFSLLQGKTPQIPAMLNVVLAPKGKLDIIQVQPASRHCLFVPQRTNVK